MNLLDILCFALACFCAFFGMMNLLSLQGYLLLLSTVLLYFSFLFRGIPKLKFPFWLIVLFGIFYNLFSYWNGVWGIRDLIYFLFCPPAFYLLGNSSIDNKDSRLICYLVAFASGMFASAFSVVANTFLAQGIGLGGGQQLLPHFGSAEIMSRTGLSLYLMPSCGIAIPFLFSFVSKKNANCQNVVIILSALVIWAFSAFCSNQIGNRAFIVAFALLTLFACLGLVLKLKSKEVKAVLIVLMCLVVIFCFMLILGYVPSFLAKIPVFQRFFSGGSNENRFNMYKQFLLNFWRKPFGGTFQYLEDYYLHNFWLDIYTFTGIVPFALFTFLMGCSFADYFTFKRSSFENSFGLEAALWAVLSLCCIGLFEPLFQANPFTFCPFALFIGACAASKKQTIKTDVIRL